MSYDHLSQYGLIFHPHGEMRGSLSIACAYYFYSLLSNKYVFVCHIEACVNSHCRFSDKHFIL